MQTEPAPWTWCVTSSPRARFGLAPALSLCLAAALTAVAVGLALPLLVLQAALPRLEGQLEVRGLDTALRIAREIAAEVEAEMTNPGQVRVTVIRETRAVEVAN